MNILYILSTTLFLLGVVLFLVLINSNKGLIKVLAGIACGACILIAMSYMAEQHRFSYDDGSLTHLGVEYYHLNGDGTTTSSITGEVFTSEVVPSMYGPKLVLYRNSKKVKVLVMHN